MSAKLLALCVCPALAVAPLTVPTVRHKVAHSTARTLHRAADRIDKTAARKEETPCVPLGGAPIAGEAVPAQPVAAAPVDELATLEPEATAQAETVPLPDYWAAIDGPIDGYYPVIPDGGGGGGGGGGGNDGEEKPVPPAPPPIAAVPEPANWVMLTTGFGLAGYAARRQQRLAARAAKDTLPRV